MTAFEVKSEALYSCDAEPAGLCAHLANVSLRSDSVHSYQSCTSGTYEVGTHHYTILSLYQGG